MASGKKPKIELAMTDSPPFIDIDGTNFERLMKEVEGFVFSDMENYIEALEYLRERIRSAIYNYFVDRYVAVEIFGSNLNKLREPAAVMIEGLRDEISRSQVFFALDGSPGGLGYTNLRYEGLLTELEGFVAGLPLPQNRKRARPARTDLRALVERLAHEWRVVTSKPFEQSWHKGAPTNPAMRFVHAVVQFTDRKSLRALPKMTERVVAERRHARPGKSPPWIE
jgi:hypothetical protein